MRDRSPILGSEESFNAAEPTLSFNTTAGALRPPPGGTHQVQSALETVGYSIRYLFSESSLRVSGEFDDAGILQDLFVGVVYPVAGRTALPGGFEDSPDDLAAVGSG